MKKKVSYDLLTLGDTTIDLFYQVDEKSEYCSIDQKSCVVCFSFGDKLPVKSFVRSMAGNSTNVAVSASRLGLNVAFWTVVGEDGNGKEIVNGLKNEGVSTQFVTYDKKHPTNVHVVLHYKGDRTIFVYHQPFTYPKISLPQTSWVYFSSAGKGFEKNHPQLIKEIRRVHARLAFNPGTYQLSLGYKVLLPILKECEILFVNREEAAGILGVTPSSSYRDLLQGLISLGPRHVVITDGQAGAAATDGVDYWFIGLFGGERFEATGAGDAFAAGVLSGLIQGNSFFEALRWGPVNSWGAVSKIGPQAGLFTFAQLRSHLKKKPNFKPTRLS